MKKHWYDYLWIASLAYLALGFVNILFAWLGLICFFLPLGIALAKGTKGYCNRYCGRGQLFSLLGGRLGLSRKRDIPVWMKSKGFRYGFLIFFFAMFFQMLWTCLLYTSGIRRRAGAHCPGKPEQPPLLPGAGRPFGGICRLAFRSLWGGSRAGGSPGG